MQGGCEGLAGTRGSKDAAGVRRMQRGCGGVRVQGEAREQRGAAGAAGRSGAQRGCGGASGAGACVSYHAAERGARCMAFRPYSASLGPYYAKCALQAVPLKCAYRKVTIIMPLLPPKTRTNVLATSGKKLPLDSLRDFCYNFVVRCALRRMSRQIARGL